jgi:hypothetical protein
MKTIEVQAARAKQRVRLLTHAALVQKNRFAFCCLLLALLTCAGPAVASQARTTIRGVVKDYPLKLGLPGATIYLYSEDRIRQVKSDSEGRFELADVPPGTYELQIRLRGFKSSIVERVKVENAEVGPLQFFLHIDINGECGKMFEDSYEAVKPQSGGRIAVLVRDTMDPYPPMPEASILLFRFGETQVVAKGRSNEKGEFEFKNVAPGKYIVKVSFEGYNDTTTASLWVTREDLTKTTIHMLRTGSLIVCA